MINKSLVINKSFLLYILEKNYINKTKFSFLHTLNGSICKLVALHAEVARLIPGLTETALIYSMHKALRGYCP